jgi:CsoR family transcriptional regulator, copper-sensing transcriptional repressor
MMTEQKSKTMTSSLKKNGARPAASGHPDHSEQKKRLNRIKGQVAGVERMIDERRYCVDIITQVKAARSALKALENAIFEGHLRACVRSTFETKNAFDSEKKIREIIDILT